MFSSPNLLLSALSLAADFSPNMAVRGSMRLSYFLKGSWNYDTLKEKHQPHGTNLAAMFLSVTCRSYGSLKIIAILLL